MSLPELKPVLQKIDHIRDVPGARDVFESVHEWVEAAQTPSMAQSACSRIITMSYPRAWGDCVIDEVTLPQGWIAYLHELAEVANACAQRVFEANHQQSKP